MQSTPWALLNSLLLNALRIRSLPHHGGATYFGELPSSIANPLREFMVLTRDDTDSTHAIWLENGLVKSLVLTPKLSNKPSTVKGRLCTNSRCRTE